MGLSIPPTLVKWVITATIGWLLSWITGKFKQSQTDQKIAEDAVAKAAGETQVVVKETKDIRDNYTNPTDPGDLAKRLRDRESGDAKHKGGTGGTNHDPAPVRIDPLPAQGNMPRPPDPARKG